MIPGDRQSDGWFHGEVAQGRGGKEPVTARKRGRQEEGKRARRRKECGGGGGGAGEPAILIPLSMKADKNWRIV